MIYLQLFLGKIIKNMKKIVLFAIVVTIIYSCGSNDMGEIAVDKLKRKFHRGKLFAEKPLGMALIPSGSFTMGKQDEDDTNPFRSSTKTVIVNQFYIDETEITNDEYRKFVYWVRDSVVRTKLAIKAEDEWIIRGGKKANGKPLNRGIYDFSFISVDTKDPEDANPYQKYMKENHYDIEEELDPLRLLNWEEDIIWDKDDYPDIHYAEIMVDSLYYIKEDNSIYGNRTFNTNHLKYKYSRPDMEKGKRGSRKDLINIYPDTLVWLKGFNYSYNDAMHKNYFHHQAYGDYPVVGVNWHQAKAFCDWRTKYKSIYLISKRKKDIYSNPFRLPTEDEWEYAARGGLDSGKYPWESTNIVDAKGNFLAKFKFIKSNLNPGYDKYTTKVKSYKTNDYGLYNMAGNVSEWTDSDYDPGVLNKIKTIRGGSWRDISYFLEVGSRDYEYADTARSYIGFRTVQSYWRLKK